MELRYELKELKIELLEGYPNHKFKTFEGIRLATLVSSIKDCGIINPIIVRPYNEKYQIISGHNRVKAAKIAEIFNIPAIVILNTLIEEDVLAISCETNLRQRSFSDMTHSEKAAILSSHYSLLKSQGRRNDLLKQIDIYTSSLYKGQDSKRDLGDEFGMSSRNVARYIRIDKLIPQLKIEIDDLKISIRAGVDLSYLNDTQQVVVYDIVKQYKKEITMKKAELLKKYASRDDLDDDAIIDLLVGDKIEKKEESKRMPVININKSLITKHFKEYHTSEFIQNIIDKSLALYMGEIKNE